MSGPGELPSRPPAPIIGRDAGLARLGALVDPAPQAGQVLLVTGEAGMGKTALLADAAEQARSAGIRVLPVTGRESESRLAFAGLHQLLRPVLPAAAVLYSFGREDTLDRAAIKRLVASLSKLLDPADALAATAGPDLVFLESRPFGGAFVLDALWRRLGIDQVITGLDGTRRRGRPRDAAVTERVLFGLVANRALAPSSKLAAAEWISSDVHIENLPAIGEQACYRAMDWLLEIREQLEEEIFGKVSDLLGLEVDLLFFDYPANQVRGLALAA